MKAKRTGGKPVLPKRRICKEPQGFYRACHGHRECCSCNEYNLGDLDLTLRCSGEWMRA